MTDQLTVDEPNPIINPPPQPLFSLRRLVIVLLLVGAGAFVFVVFRDAPTSGGGTGCDNTAVAGWNPCPGGRVLRQSQIGVTLAQGYDGRISVNGIAIPEAQMVGAILPGTEAYKQLSPEEQAKGPRPNNKTLVAFEPGKGKVITQFTGQLDIAITFWQVSDGPAAAQTIDYTVFVT